ncbi:MAG: four helix bundle protein [Gemmatimonadaceae bacterium]
MSDFRKLKVWGKSHALALNAISVAKKIRGSESSALRMQMIRAAMSIPTNIVEGSGQESSKEFGRFLSIAIKSSSELEYHLVLAADLQVITKNDFASLTDQTVETRKMLYTLRSRVVASAKNAPRAVPA